MKKSLFLLAISHLIFASLPGCSHTNIVNIDLARQLIERHANGGEAGYQFVIQRLHAMDKGGLSELRLLIKNDLEHNAGIIISPPLRSEQCLAYEVLNLIDERLGELKYDFILEGYFTEYNSSASCITYYNFMSDDGELSEVYKGVYTIKPSYGYLIDYDEHVRIYVKWIPVSGEIFKSVVKIEIIKEQSTS